MNLEKRNNHKKKIIIGGLIGLSVLTVGIFASSYSKYRVTESIKLGEGIINYTGADFEVVGMYIINKDGTETEIDTVPGAGYIINTEKTKCTVNDSEVAASIEYKDNKLFFGDITEKGTKCKVYFEQKPKASDAIIGNVTVKPGTDSFTGPATTEEDSGLFSTTDDDGTTYYYRGILSDDTINNWVDFAGYKWRIIRINGDDSIRIIYNGKDYITTGTGTQLASTSNFNAKASDNTYVGYMYGQPSQSTYEATHANTNSSTIKGVLDNWYKTNILDKNFDKYVSKETGYCGDRKAQSMGGSYTGNGSGTSVTSYAPWARLSELSWKTTQTPTYSCNINDLYSLNISSKGNKALTYPVGLITSDEVIYAGAFGGVSNAHWLQTGQPYWTMSPSHYYSSGNVQAGVFVVYTDGSLSNPMVTNKEGVRPVINLASDVQLTGRGTTTDPYKIAN